MELDEREGSVEYHKRLRTLWVAWEPDVRMCVGNGKKGPESKLARWERLWAQLQSFDFSFGHLHQSAQLRVAGGQVFMT